MSATILANREKAEPLGVIAAEFGTNPKQLGRWALEGLKLPDGSRVKLEAYRFGRSLRTSRQAVERFIGALTKATVSGPDDEAVTPAQRRALDEAASARLTELLAK